MKKLIPVLLVGATLSLTGCSAVENLLYGEETHHYDDVETLAEDWSGATTVEWMPGDASDITIRQSTDGTVAILGFASGEELDCPEVERLSGPTFGDDWAPSDVYVDTVFACGSWAMIPTDTGWYGWTPSAPGEREGAPGEQEGAPGEQEGAPGEQEGQQGVTP